jgi:hypothetical protein
MSREEQYECVLNHLKKRGVSEDYLAFLETQTIFNENKPYKGYIIFEDYKFILHITIPENILVPIYAVTTLIS